jgi:hypothetical protein
MAKTAANAANETPDRLDRATRHLKKRRGSRRPDGWGTPKVYTEVLLSCLHRGWKFQRHGA